RLLKLSEKAKVIVGIDSIDVAQPISDYAEKRGMKIPVLIKIDVGLQRLGVPYGKSALELAKKIDKMKGLKLEGIYTHEGHAYGVTDNSQIKTIALSTGDMMLQTAEMIKTAGIEINTISVGSTPTVRTSLTINGITEVRPGAYVFNDYFEMRLGISSENDCAFTILSTVISVPSENRAIIDAGTKSYTSDKAQAFGVYGLIKGMSDVKLVRAYEEHGVLDIPKGKLKVGDKIEVIPNHVCPVVNLYDELVALRKDKIETIWKVSARGKLK
ncbi:MAG: alanine racemase, partial [Candidatus Poribacteria bacterium]